MNQKDISEDALSTKQSLTYVPTDYTDVGQGTLLANTYRHCLCHCSGIGWLTYIGGLWKTSDSAAQSFSQELTTLQLQEAVAMRYTQYKQSGSSSEADKYMQYAHARRSSGRINAAITEAKPMLTIAASVLDADPLLLNTPAGEVDLRTGEMMPHEPEHYITHMTTASPSNEGAEIWRMAMATTPFFERHYTKNHFSCSLNMVPQ